MTVEANSGWLPLARLCTALRFLTLLPISWRAEEDSRRFPESLPYFVVVGALIGGGGAGFVSLLQLLVPQAVAAMLVIAMLAAISGFLHLDGLADSADGLLSSRPREMRLAIMKDSRSGAMAIVTVVLLLLTKYAALSSLSPQLLPATVFLMALAGRTAILVMMAGLPYARQEGGIGALFYSGNSRRAAIIALLVLILCGGWLVARQFVALVLVFAGIVVIFSWWCHAKLGGATGDTLGAVCELAEAGVAVAMTVGYSLHSQ